MEYYSWSSIVGVVIGIVVEVVVGVVFRVVFQVVIVGVSFVMTKCSYMTYISYITK